MAADDGAAPGPSTQLKQGPQKHSEKFNTSDLEPRPNLHEESDLAITKKQAEAHDLGLACTDGELEDSCDSDFVEFASHNPALVQHVQDLFSLTGDEEDVELASLSPHELSIHDHLKESGPKGKPLTGKMDVIRGLPLPKLPEGWSAPGDFKALGTISKPKMRAVEPVGPAFLAFARRKRHNRTFSEDDRIQAQEKVKRIEPEDSAEISEDEDPLMLQRDAKDWKGQDHYAVLGLSKYRYKATEDQIKRAHRKKVLRHHPDKRAAAGGTEDDSFFKCIQKANEILLDPVKRRQFDSVDENADVEPPSKKEAAKSGKFFKLWSPVFESEARFSKVQPVPMLGNDKSTKEHVEHFYDFWYNFDSWRSFEYQDEDVPDDNENRDQKRHMERKNNNARKKKKTEDTARLRRVVDDCLAGDERIKRFRTEERAGKNKKRLEREEAERKVKEEAAAKKAEDDRLAKERAEAEKAEKADAKKLKEAAKNAVKKNKRVLKGSVKDVNYFVPAGTNPSAKDVDDVLNLVDFIAGRLEPEEIGRLAASLNGKKNATEVKGIWKEEADRLVGAGKLKEGDVKALSR